MALTVWTQRSGYRFSTIQERSIVDLQLPTAGDVVTTLQITNAGTNYPTNGGSASVSGGSGTGMVVQYACVSNQVIAISVNIPGVGYRDGDVITILAGNSNCQFTLNIDFLVTYSVISGKLPIGLRIVNNTIQGTPFEVPRTTDFEFVIRASNGTQIADRTFFWTIEGSDEPEWQTAAGTLPIGPNDQYYILDSSYVDFQLSVTDFDTATGQSLKFFQPKDGGQLPPGLILTQDGRIVGWIQPALAIPLNVGTGAYDTAVFDTVAYDFGYRPSNGYDSYLYDTTNYDYSVDSLTPKKLNRYYEFLVTVTDGDTSSTRKFKIFVVGDDYFRADTVAINSGNGAYTVDGTYVRAPIWVTPSNLGVRRANNYVTLKLDTYEAIDLGQITYSLDTVNPVMSAKAYTTSTLENKIGRNLLRIRNASAVPTTASKISLSKYVTGADSTVYKIVNVQTISSTEYVLTVLPNLTCEIFNNTFLELGTLSILPPGIVFDSGTSEVFGVVPYQPAITQTYNFSITATRYSDKAETASATRTFTIQLIGELDSVITWNSPSALGTIGANYISTLALNASSTIADSAILYVLESGSLPPGLTLALDGEIVGKVNQFGSGTRYCGTWVSNRNYLLNDVVKYSGVYYKRITPGSSLSFNIAQWDLYSFTNPGIITFDGGDLLLDAGDTTVDKSYTFTVQARDILSYSAISRTFTLDIDTPNDRLYSNMVVKPFLKQSQRDAFREFITDSNIFSSGSIYRPSDPNFGIQNDLKMLVFAGIETKSAAEVVSAVGRNHKPKKFKLGDVKKAQAKITGTNTVVYEIIYIEVIDPLEIGKISLPNVIATVNSNTAITIDQNNQYYNGPFNQDTSYFKPADPFEVSIDRSDVFAGDPNSSLRFPASVALWRERIKSIGLRERNYLPLWMRTIQDGSVQELDYVKAIPLCYCKPGTGDDILLNIKNRAFDFKQIDYVIDRYIIDSVTGYSADKYIAFKNDRTTIS